MARIAGGADNIGLVVSVLRDLGITNVATLVDGNRERLNQQLREQFPEFSHAVLPTDDIRDKKGSESRPKVGVCTSSGELKPEYEETVLALINQLGQ